MKLILIILFHIVRHRNYISAANLIASKQPLSQLSQFHTTSTHPLLPIYTSVLIWHQTKENILKRGGTNLKCLFLIRVAKCFKSCLLTSKTQGGETHISYGWESSTVAIVVAIVGIFHTVIKLHRSMAWGKEGSRLGNWGIWWSLVSAPTFVQMDLFIKIVLENRLREKLRSSSCFYGKLKGGKRNFILYVIL